MGWYCRKGCQVVISSHWLLNDFTEVLKVISGVRIFCLFRHCRICNMNQVFANCQEAELSGSGGRRIVKMWGEEEVNIIALLDGHSKDWYGCFVQFVITLCYSSRTLKNCGPTLLFCCVCFTTSGQNLSTGPLLCSFYIIHCIFIAWPNHNVPNVLIHFALVLALKSRVVHEITWWKKN